MRTKLVILTGTPGTGKTVIGKKLSLLLDYTYLNGDQLIKSEKLASEYDKTRHVPIVDPLKFAISALKRLKIESKQGSKGLILDSHISHFMPASKVDACLVFTCAINVLHKRLAKRGYPKSKIRENLDAEIFDTILLEAKKRYKKITKVDTSTSKVNVKKLATHLLHHKSGLGPD